MPYRIEQDTIGRIKIPSEAYYGASAQRALENFPISGLNINKEFIIAYAIIKKTAALTNVSLGKLDKKRGDAIVRACNEIINGKLLSQFRLDVFQAGAGTNTNMALNEVIANRAIEILNGKRGDYKIVHPNDHVNMSQSTNDTFHAAIHLSAYLYIGQKLIPSLKHLHSSLAKKQKEFKDLRKVGRTHLQDAVPITLGEEFSGYSDSVKKEIAGIVAASKTLLELPLGGTAVGNEANAPKGYSQKIIKEINKLTKANFTKSNNFFRMLQNQSEEVVVSSALNSAAIALSKIANDLRLLNSGPRSGLSEIKLPVVQAGSSIMPGKANPSIPEMVNMVCFQIMGNNSVIYVAAESGQLELNVFMPVIAYNLLQSIQILSNSSKVFSEKCILGIKANRKVLEAYFQSSTEVATLLTPELGYDKTAWVVKEALKKGISIKEVVLKNRLLSKKKLDKILK